MTYSIYDDNVAEAMFHFLNETNAFEDFCVKNEFYDFSIAEYIVEFCLDDFKVYALNKFDIEIE